MTISAAAIDSPNSRPKSKPKVWRSKAQWKALLDELATSGLTKSAFCQQHSIAPSNLYRWQKILAEASAPTDFIDISEPLVQAVPAAPILSSDSLWQVELELGAGMILRVRTH